MFGIFSKKKKPQSALDEFIFAVYGNPPPPKRAKVGQAVEIAKELLMGIIDEEEIRRQAISLNDGPIPYSTHDLALSIALDFFKKPENVSQLFEAQLITRMKMGEWLEQGLVAPVLVRSFEDVLYDTYKPDMNSHMRFHFLKESFMPLVHKYQMAAKIIEVEDDSDLEEEVLYSFFFTFDAPGREFGVETDEVISHYWELINYIDEQESDINLMAMDPTTGEVKPADGQYFVFEWCGEFETNTTLTIDVEIFVDYLNLLIEENSDDSIFNIETLRNTNVINRFIE